MQQRSLWKTLFISFFAVLVVACKPIASFSVSPDPVQAGVEATFDASSTVIYNKPSSNAAKSYAWDFGDGSTGSGKVTSHTFEAAGSFKVKLTVIDTAGRVGTTTENLVVVNGDVATPETTSLQVITQIAGGVALSGADVTVDSLSATSNDDGLATLDAAPVGEDQVVIVKKDGYVTQSVRATLVAGDEPQQLLVLLMPEKDTLSIADIAAAQTITSNYLGASITVPANTFVNADTLVPATGAASVKVTPWDISSIDLQAMPGNGLARDASGDLVSLISAGMMSVEFFDAAGNKLQVAAGKSAAIQMRLPDGTTSIGGNAIADGTVIPMWHFDEAQGLWIEEGTGTVVATATGLAVYASVSHFSTWNWDYVTATPVVVGGTSGGSGSTDLTISCIDTNGALIACTLRAQITYPDGSLRSWGATIPAAETTINNIPGNPTLVWTATTVDGLKGTATSGTTGNVVIQLESPNINHFVRCLAPGSVATACKVTRSVPLLDGSVDTITSYIPAEGANVYAHLDTIGPVTWAASTAFARISDSTWTNYGGTASSDLTGDVTINLEEQTGVTEKTIFVSCAPTVTDPSTNQEVALTSCSLQITAPDMPEINIPSGLNGPVAVTLPPLDDNAQVVVHATGFTTPVWDTPIGGAAWDFYGSIPNNQQFVIQLYAGDYALPN